MTLSKQKNTRAEKLCFFCGEQIHTDLTDEHIFPDSFLAEHNLKNESVNLLNGNRVTYSRIKVPSHRVCNNEFGSRYEEKILSILRNLDTSSEVLENAHSSISVLSTSSSSEIALLISWFAKLFFGMIWFEANLKKYDNIKLQESLKEILASVHFSHVQKSYSINQGFFLPSSFYYYRLSSPGPIPFTQGSHFYPACYWMKIGVHLFVVALGDGQLCYRFLNDEIIKELKEIEIAEGENPFFCYYFISQLISVRKHLPKQPRFIVGEDFSIINMSHSTSSLTKYSVDSDLVNAEANNIYKGFLKSHGIEA